MLVKHKKARQTRRQMALGLTVMAGLIAQSYAQDTVPAATPAVPAAPAAAQDEPMTVVQVSGYRNSLLSSAKDKKEAVGFQDSINSEDFGKFPDKNIAESLARIPGVGVSRDVTGEGSTIQIRGLGSSFTKILLNGAPIAVASSGPVDGANTNREVDLDLLPTDLFTKLTVSKSPTADQIEGGAAGVVNMRSARPFDKEGRYITGGFTGTKQQIADKAGGRGFILASQTFGNWGILGGITLSRQQVHTTGWESVGWTNANLSAAQNTSSTRNNTGGGNYTVPSTVPVGAGAGLTAGTVIDQAWLLANNPGLTIQQIDNAILPRLGRSMDYFGTKDKGAAILSAEYRPSENLHFYIDTMYSKRDDKMTRMDYDWSVRNGGMIPMNMTVDKSDCSNGCTVTSGTFANTSFFFEHGYRHDQVSLLGLNPGMEWKITPTLKLDAQINYTRSNFSHEAPTVYLTTAANSGVTATYANNGGIPTITSNVDLNNPANYVWSGGRVNVQNEFRKTETKGFHSDLTWGDDKFSIKGGVAYDDITRRIRATDNSAAWQAAVCGNNPNVFLSGPNGAPTCDGASTPGTSAASLYPGYGTGYTTGATTPLVNGGSLIPQSALASYIIQGPYGKPIVDWARFSKDSNYQQYFNSAPDSGSSSTGASSGYIGEKTTGLYAEANGKYDLAGFPMRYNAGVRYVRTKQSVGSLNSISDPRNASLTLNGSKYPNIDQWVYQDTTYNNTLPSATAAINLRSDVIARAAISRSMTRADPNALRPGVNFSSVSADVGSVGNPALKPYLSDNIDIGLDWYTGREGYVSITGFQKKVDGFTISENITAPFSSLAAYGINYGTLTPNQQAAINSRGGPDVATVVLTRSRNAAGELRIRGLELGWVQPLDKILPIRGFGINETATFITQRGSGEGAAGFVALGVPNRTNNFSVYYENHGYMARLSHTFSKGSQVAGTNQNGITNAALYSDNYKQLDFSSSVDLGEVFDKDNWPSLSFDIVNLNNDSRRTYYQFSNATYSIYSPGRSYALGLRFKF
ncbi:TonB-dependent receptor [Duganella sp. FT80W]|uniref:TonB-dependent receptor n=1 Tax=Duganella guangzhouensis TaxID=2666084 RepID=A0A6I2L3P3_9BURK|nr:TonB-dependent receptor [Duganella guangzhouensis]MRW92493.1 TonB-dependent receptor [Duganella guangzhouensis]